MNNYEVNGRNFVVILGGALQKYGVPNGFEVDRKPEDRAISVRVSQGTVADILDAIVKQAPGYKWVETNGVVNVLPKRDANSVLDLRIAHFRVHDARANELSRVIASLPEVRAWLAQNAVTERSVYGILGPAVQPAVVSLDLDNLTLREIMNRIVKEPGFSNWLFERYGSQNEYLTIGIG